LYTVCDYSTQPRSTAAHNLIGAANRFPDKCDADPDGARAINVSATASLAHATSSRTIFLIYISTDYVFPGRPGEAPYEADAPTEPPNLYGQTKLDGEKAVLEATSGTGFGVVLRVPVLYGKGSKEESAINVLEDAVRKASSDTASVSMDDWARRYPTNTEEVGRVCKDIANKYIFAPDSERKVYPQVLQFSGEECFTKYEICQLMGEILHIPTPGLKANKEGNDPQSTVQRPYDTHLSTRALKDLGIKVSAMRFKDWL